MGTRLTGPSFDIAAAEGDAAASQQLFELGVQPPEASHLGAFTVDLLSITTLLCGPSSRYFAANALTAEFAPGSCPIN